MCKWKLFDVPGCWNVNLEIKLQLFSSMIREERMIFESKEICLGFQYFSGLYETHAYLLTTVGFASCIGDKLCFSSTDIECCEIPITAENIWNAKTIYTKEKPLRQESRHFELYFHKLRLLSYLLADVYRKWEQNDGVTIATSRGVVVLLWKEPNGRGN